jgi:hypothetical protein
MLMTLKAGETTRLLNVKCAAEQDANSNAKSSTAARIESDTGIKRPAGGQNCNSEEAPFSSCGWDFDLQGRRCSDACCEARYRDLKQLSSSINQEPDEQPEPKPTPVSEITAGVYFFPKPVKKCPDSKNAEPELAYALRPKAKQKEFEAQTQMM